MNLRTTLATTTAAIALCAASTANAADPYLSFFGGLSTFDDEIQFGTSIFNPGFGGSGFGFSTPIAGGGVCLAGTPTTSGYLCFASGFYRVDGNFYFGSAKYGTSDFSWEEEFDSGFVVGAAMGTDLGNGFRAELELAYRTADMDGGATAKNEFDGINIQYGHVSGDYNLYQFTASGTTPLATGVPIGTVSIPQMGTNPAFPFALYLPSSTTRDAVVQSHGEVNVWSIMANVWMDIDPFGINPEGVTTFIGGGIGMANLELNYDADISTLLGGTFGYSLDDNESAIAYQLGAGIGFDLGGGMSLSAQYRWFATDDVDLGNTDMRVESHNAMIGLTLPMGVLLP